MQPIHPSTMRCLERQAVAEQGWRPHVCVETPDHLLLGIPHTCTCGFQWWRTVPV